MKILRKLAPVMAAVLATGVVAVVDTSPAAAATVDTSAWYVLLNRNSGKALDVYNLATNDGARITQWARNDLRIAQYLRERFAGAADPREEDVESYIRRHEAELRRTGRALNDPEVQRLAREGAAAERHEAVVAEWVQGLRARAGVSTTPPLRE